MGENWDDIADWWVDAVREDPGQSDDTLAILSELLSDSNHSREGDRSRSLTIDLGCGEGQSMRLIDGSVIGTDYSMDLLRRAASAGPVVLGRMPDLGWVRPGVFDRAVSVGLLDVIDDHVSFFSSVALAVRPGGQLLVVINHPVATAPESEPLVDPNGEILWRWGSYLTTGSWPHEAGERTVDLVHRPVGELLTAAATAGWNLDQMIERGPSAASIERFHEYHGQAHIPSLAGFCWTRGPSR